MTSFQHTAAVLAFGVSLLIGCSLNADVNLCSWLWPMLPLKVLDGCGLCAQYRCREGFLFSAG